MNSFILKYKNQTENIVVKEMMDTFGKNKLESWGFVFSGEFLVFGTHLFRTITPMKLFTCLILGPKFSPKDSESILFALKFARTQIKHLEILKDANHLINDRDLNLLSMSPLNQTNDLNEAIDKQTKELSTLVLKLRRELILGKGRNRLHGIFSK